MLRECGNCECDKGNYEASIMKEPKGMKRLDTLLARYMNVKTYTPVTLFDLPPKWEMLKSNKCPECGNKLLLMRKAPLAYCRGKRHPDGKQFIIQLDKLAQILAR